MSTCKYCSTPLDQFTLRAAADMQEKVNSACNEASNIRNYAGAMWVLFLVRLIPLGFIALGGLIGMLGMFLIVPVRLVIWLIRYGAIKTGDADFRKARYNIGVAALLWLPAAVLLALNVLALIGMGLK
ncbi:MAG: hypothetical protein JO360_11760 [Acidobacteria bacterium]|nr:hypothetical protein [Acidobacteriota bacterium]